MPGQDPSFSDIQELPIFPLPNVVFFPRTILPLHIFEPRYKQMVDDAMARDRYLSVALRTEGEATEPPAICGLGQITDVERLPKNEKNIVVVGLGRVQVLREVESEPYIRAEVEPLEETTPDADTHERIFTELRDAVRSWLFRMRTGNVRRLADFGRVRSVAEMCDFFGAYLLDDFGERQRLLEQLDVARRAERIIELVDRELYRYSAPFEN